MSMRRVCKEYIKSMQKLCGEYREEEGGGLHGGISSEPVIIPKSKKYSFVLSSYVDSKHIVWIIVQLAYRYNYLDITTENEGIPYKYHLLIH